MSSTSSSSPSFSTGSSSEDELGILQTRRKRYKRRHQHRAYINLMGLMHDLLVNDATFEFFFGVSKVNFLRLQYLFVKDIRRRLTYIPGTRPYRERDRLALCLRYLASGKTFADLGQEYNVPADILETMIFEICEIMIQYFQPLVMPQPTKQMWKLNAEKFNENFDIPNVVGALNGRYITIDKHSTHVLLGIVDHNCKFVMIDFGDYLCGEPSKVWQVSKMSKRVESGEACMPSYKRIGEHVLPYVIIGGNSMPANSYIIKKFREYDIGELKDVHKIFNSRIAPVKEVADEAMTRLRRRWQIIQKCFYVEPDQARRLILTCCCLHNYFMEPTI